MTLLIAWRNIWRNPSRSLVVIVAVALGLWAGLSMSAFSLGIADQRARDQIKSLISHLQVHDPAFTSERELKALIPGAEAILAKARELPGVEGAAGRFLAAGMISSPRKSSGVMINGVDPEAEDRVTGLAAKVTQGEYLGSRSNGILISERSAEILGVELRKKLVLTFQDSSGEMISAAFRVVGLFRSFDSKYDEANVFVQAADLQAIVGMPGAIHEIALLAEGKAAVPAIQSALIAEFPGPRIENWLERSPEMRLMNETMDSVLWIFVGVIVLALSFGIVNTMLMAVLERTHELGMLMAVGMSKPRVFRMILAETFFLTMVGAPAGLFFAWATVAWLGQAGLDMSAFAEGMSQMGMSSVVYPYLEIKYYIQVLLIVSLAAFLSAIYPALKALSLKPVEAIRSL